MNKKEGDSTREKKKTNKRQRVHRTETTEAEETGGIRANKRGSGDTYRPTFLF